MWLALAFLSALLLGFYDVSKKYSLRNNAVIPILFLNTLFCSIIFLPLAFPRMGGAALYPAESLHRAEQLVARLYWHQELANYDCRSH